MIGHTLIKDLAVISDRHSCALINKQGSISWYCPRRFDAAAIFSSLLDADKGGAWNIEADNLTFLDRQFLDRSSILKTYFSTGNQGMTVTDFMAIGSSAKGIFRKFSPASINFVNTLKFKPDYGLKDEVYIHWSVNTVYLQNTGHYLHCSHPLEIVEDIIRFSIPAGENGWAYLGDAEKMDTQTVDDCFNSTLQSWKDLESLVNYHGPYENQVRYSLRALQQMVYEPTGGIVAAATTSLPEVLGGERNYDYRYVWMRDAALITSSLTQIITTGELEEKFIAFIAGAMKLNHENHVSCFYAIDQQKVSPEIRKLPLTGYMDSQPVQIGNSASEQFQLDAEANILIACSLIYQKLDTNIHWDTVNQIADFICKNWERPDNGIWEEEKQQHYTSSKAFAARGLELIAPYQKDKSLAKRWMDNAKLIRKYIKENCMTTNGAFAVHAGSEDVDVTAALFVPFGIYDADSEAMQATVNALEKSYCEQHLYRRHLLEFDSAMEGPFLAGSCWMAHYYAIAGNLQKSKHILDAVLTFSNDLGYFSEEAELQTGQMLGNFPQTFVHSSFICAVNGYKKALAGEQSIVNITK